MTDKPSKNEDEYFARLEVERRREAALEHEREMAEAEKQKRRDLHYMKCPKCGADLHTLEFRGIALDRCYSCHGTWFDHGEMEQLLKKQEFLDRVMGVFRDVPLEDQIEESARKAREES